MVTSPATTVDEYIAAAAEPVRPILTELRLRIHAAVPGSGEAISYQIPTITVDGRALVYFAAWKNHISLYPLPTVDPALADELAPYRAAKSTLRFPLRRPVPYDLIIRVVTLLRDQRA